WTEPVILPPGHHIIVAGRSVPSTLPCQMHISGLMSTLVRVMVRTVFSLSATVILAEPWGSVRPVAVAPLISAYSIMGANGAAIMPMPTVDLAALAISIMCFC